MGIRTKKLEKKMVEYSTEEKALVENCLNFYKKREFPEATIDRNDPKNHITALEYCHLKGEFIKTLKTHDLLYSILAKNGIETESNEARQARLAKERAEVIRAKRVELRKAAVEEAEKQVKTKKEDLEKEKKAIADLVAKEKGINRKEAMAKKAQLEAERLAKEKDEEIEKLKALLQQKENEKALAEASGELAKEEEATIEPEKIIKEPPAEIIEPEEIGSSSEAPISEPVAVAKEDVPEEVPPVPEPEPKEKTIDELIEDLKSE